MKYPFRKLGGPTELRIGYEYLVIEEIPLVTRPCSGECKTVKNCTRVLEKGLLVSEETTSLMIQTDKSLNMSRAAIFANEERVFVQTGEDVNSRNG